MTDKSIQTPSFEHFGEAFQEKIMQALLVDHRWAQQMFEIINTDFFELEYLRYLSTKYFEYFDKYKGFPTLALLVQIVRDDFKSTGNNDAALRDQIVKYLRKIRDEPGISDLGYVKDKAFDFCRRQAFKLAIEETIDLVLVGEYDDIINRVKKAMAAGSPAAVGHEFLVDFEQRFKLESRHPIPTGLKELDQRTILNGGLGEGELGCVVAGTGAGKSHFLVMLGANAMLHGKNILHYTFELSEKVTGLRYDSNICRISSTDIPLKKDDVLAQYKKYGKKLGRLFIKEYPANFATINTLKSHHEKLQITKDFIPDIILIDYADIMRSTQRYDSLRHELKLVYEELRGWATELGIPIWTASQSNRDGSDHEVIELKNISEAYGKAMVADVILSLSRKLSDRADNTGRLYLAKSRVGRDGIVWNVEIDTSISSISIIGEYSTATDAKIESNTECDRLLKTKWKEVRETLGSRLVDPVKSPIQTVEQILESNESN